MRHVAKIFSEEEPRENDNQQGEERIMNWTTKLQIYRTHINNKHLG